MSVLLKAIAGYDRRAAPGRRLTFWVARPDSDLPAIIDLARQAHTESRFGYIPFSEEKVRKIAARGFAQPERNLAVLAGAGDRTFGFIYCSAGELHIGTDVLLMTIHVVYVAKEVRSTLLGGRVSLGLFRAAERWSRAIGAREVLLHVTSDVSAERAGRTARHLGFEGIGDGYAKKL